jgi:hypothetical protein
LPFAEGVFAEVLGELRSCPHLSAIGQDCNLGDTVSAVEGRGEISPRRKSSFRLRSMRFALRLLFFSQLAVNPSKVVQPFISKAFEHLW